MQDTTRWVCWTMLACVATSLSAETLQLDRFYPPVIARGDATTVTAEGKFPVWPPEVEADRDDVSVKVDKESGKLSVSVNADAPPGAVWIRLRDQHSLSDLVPLIVSTASVTLETEPNAKRSEADQLTLPTVVAGRLEKSGDSDAYRVSVKAGQRLVASVTAHQVLRSPMDAVLQLSDVDGNVLIQSEDVRGFDPQIVYTSERETELILRIFAFPETPNQTIGFAGSQAMVYAIDVTTGPFIDHAVSEKHSGSDRAIAFGHNLSDEFDVQLSNVSQHSPPTVYADASIGWAWLSDDWVSAVAPTATRLAMGQSEIESLPVVVCGHILKPNQTDSYHMPVAAGIRYRAEVRSRPDGFLLDSKLVVVDSESGKQIASNDDIKRGGYDAGVEFTAEQEGRVEVRLSDTVNDSGPRHFYQLLIRAVTPGFQLSAAADRFVIQPATPLEIPITIERDSGFSGQLSIEATELPAGVTSAAVVSEPKGETAKSVKLNLVATDAAPGHYPFHIVGSALDADEKTKGDPQNSVFALRPAISLDTFWLTIPPQPTPTQKQP
ncbi:serine protease [Stieleria sp. TO1_6]|nr:serine protease [Stieleria tagensis]